MKRKIIIISVLIFHYIQFYPQNNQINISFGGTISTVRFDDTAAQKAIKPYLKIKQGYSAAATWEHFFAPILSLRSVISYTQKGFSYEYPYRQGYKRFNYLTISIAGNAYILNTSSMELSLFVAPYIGYWLSGYKYEADYRGASLYAQKIKFSDSTYAYNRWEAGLEPGLSIKFWQTSNQAIIITIASQYSFVSNDKYNVAGSKNRTIYFRLGYLWTL